MERAYPGIFRLVVELMNAAEVDPTSTTASDKKMFVQNGLADHFGNEEYLIFVPIFDEIIDGLVMLTQTNNDVVLLINQKKTIVDWFALIISNCRKSSNN
jgi:hypothetical protein